MFTVQICIRYPQIYLSANSSIMNIPAILQNRSTHDQTHLVTQGQSQTQKSRLKKMQVFGKYPGKYFWKAHKKGGGEDGKEGINLLTLHPKRKIF